jgi:thiosulfate reductase cytochrome b subunit
MFTFFRWMLVALLLLFIFSQIIWPSIQRRPIFPMFRREANLRNDLAEARQRRYERQIEREIQEIDADIHVPPTTTSKEGSNT